MNMEAGKLSLSERVQVYEHLKTVLTKEGEFVTYKDGVDDEEVARIFTAKLKRPVTVAVVRNIRAETFGKIRPARTPVTGGAMQDVLDRVAFLEGRLALPPQVDAIPLTPQQEQRLGDIDRALAYLTRTVEQMTELSAIFQRKTDDYEKRIAMLSGQHAKLAEAQNTTAIETKRQLNSLHAFDTNLENAIKGLQAEVGSIRLKLKHT